MRHRAAQSERRCKAASRLVYVLNDGRVRRGAGGGGGATGAHTRARSTACRPGRVASRGTRRRAWRLRRLSRHSRDGEPRACRHERRALDRSAAGRALDADTEGDAAHAEAEPDGKNKTVLVVDFSKLSREMSGESDEELPEPMQPAGMALQEGLEEEIDLDEASLEDIVEALTVDIKPTPSGWGNNGYPDAMLNLAKEELLALAQDSEEKERLEALNKAIEKLQESNDKLNITLNEKDKKISGLSQHLVMFKEKLEEVSLLNAKLLYTNKALASNSLNERQKKYIAESLLNAKSAEETKALYETLQNAVGRDARKQSESLSEVVGRKVSSTMILSSNRKKTESPIDSTTNRWKTLAGINKTN